MQNNEYSRPYPEYASLHDLKRIFDMYAAALPSTVPVYDPVLNRDIMAQANPLELSPQDDLINTIQRSTDIPFKEIDSIVLSHLSTDFDPDERNGGTTYPESIAITVHGFYGDITPIARSISYVIAKSTGSQEVIGFAVQHFHDTYNTASVGSYMFADPHDDPHLSVYVQPTELLRTIAADLDLYRVFITNDMVMAMTDDETKRTVELRQLDTDDLILFDAALSGQITPDPLLPTEE